MIPLQSFGQMCLWLIREEMAMPYHSTVRRSPTFHLSPVAGIRIGGTGANDGNGNWASAGQKMLASAATSTVALGAFNMRSVDGDGKMATL